MFMFLTGIVNTILSWNGFIPLSRLTYAAYLVHPICMMVNVCVSYRNSKYNIVLEWFYPSVSVDVCSLFGSSNLYDGECLVSENTALH